MSARPWLGAVLVLLGACTIEVDLDGPRPTDAGMGSVDSLALVDASAGDASPPLGDATDLDGALSLPDGMAADASVAVPDASSQSPPVDGGGN